MSNKITYSGNTLQANDFSFTNGTVKPFFHPKLTINNPSDRYEQEADAVADKVMQMNTPSVQKKSGADSFFSSSPISITPLQRKCDNCKEEEKMQRKEIDGEELTADNNLENYVGGLQSGGHPLPNEARNFYEPRFGYDFSNVKIHTDAVAAKSAQSINALAYTSGSNIVFNKGQYAPETDSGKKLLGHELTHIVQQGSVNKKSIQRDLAVNPIVPGAAVPVLTPQQIRSATIFNNERYDAENITLIQDIVGGPVTGVLTDETLNLIALYQAQNGLTPDGMAGTQTFDLLTAELTAGNNSPDTCLTMFHVGLVTPMDIRAAGINRANIFGHFDVEIQFSPHCDCSRFQYRQFICGTVTYNGVNINNVFSIPGGALPAISNWVEDGNTTLPNNGRYGHRNHAANNGLPNQYTDANGAVDMQHGCKFKSTDEPGVTSSLANSGDVYVFDLRFFGDIRKDGQMIQRKFWSVRETITIP